MWERIRDLIAGSSQSHDKPAIEDATYEELFSADFQASVACREVVRRLERLLYAMVFAGTGDKQKADTLMKTLVGEIVHQFPAGSGDFCLRRLAVVIRGAIGKEAFEEANLPRLYYTHLALYHLPRKERELMKAVLDRPARLKQGDGLADELAAERGLSREEVRQTLQNGNKRLMDIMHNDFEKEHLQLITEGNLPWGKKTQ
jgi:hypothetical protein